MDGLKGGLKEYASVVTAAVSVIAALAVLGLWAINAQVTPEIKRVDGRMENYETQYTELKDRLGRMDHRLERRLDRIDNRFIQIDERFGEIDGRFSPDRRPVCPVGESNQPEVRWHGRDHERDSGAASGAGRSG